MRATLDLPKELLDALVELVGARTKGEAVTIAIEEYVRRKRLEELKAASGDIRLMDNWRELEDLELMEQEHEARRRR